jgi:DNA repair protein RecO (recombination protein O)
MEWRDQGVIILVRKHAETSAIIEVLTKTHGRHAGVVRGGTSRKLTPVLQPGNQVEVEWRARLEDHLGSYRVEPLKSRSYILNDRLALSALTAMCSLIGFAVPERMDLPRIYDQTLDLMDELGSRSDWINRYALWEKILLEELGYGLDLSSCAATGVTRDLIYVSPKSGRAVSRKGGADWAEQLLPLPDFLRTPGADATLHEVIQALKTTGYFLEHWLAPALGNRPLPAARARFAAALRKQITVF